ncbi:MAG: trigger factor [Gammaproteobacteria bacterium]|nr:trigger factor [Gammaproteobacteria bacterium]
MTYEYEQIGEFTREYTVPISQDALDGRVYELTNEVASSAHLKGFRKGKAPRKVISQRYGSAIENDVLEKIVNENCSAILSEEGLQAGWIGRPFLTAPEDAPYTYKVRVETMPKIEIGDLSELTIKRPNVILTNEEVRKQIDAARARCIEWYELKGDEIRSKSGDRVWIEFPVDFETSDDDESEVSEENKAERFPIVLRSPRNELSESFHTKLADLAIGDQLEVSREELSNELGVSEDAIPNNTSANVVRIDIGDLPHLGPTLLARPEFRHLVDSEPDADIESIEDLIPVAQRSMEQAIERTMDQVLQNRAMWALAKQYVTSVPREVLRQRFLEAAQVGEQNLQTTFMAFRLFDPIVDGETLDQKLLMATPHDQDQDHDHDNDETSDSATESESGANGEDALLPEGLRTFWTGEVNRAIQRVAFTLTQQALIEQRNIEADQEWVASQIQAKADSVNMVEDQSRAQEYLDYVYGEQHYQELVTTSLLEQATKLLLDEATIDDEDIEFESFFSQPTADDAEEPLDAFKVAPSLPEPEGFISGIGQSTADESDGSQNQSAPPNDETNTKIDEHVEALSKEGDDVRKPGIFKKLFKKNS